MNQNQERCRRLLQLSLESKKIRDKQVFSKMFVARWAETTKGESIGFTEAVPKWCFRGDLLPM